MSFELGDHIWYWNGNLSTEKNIPRASWFPGSNPADQNDYLGHGAEIYQYVIYPDEIARGRPHMRNYAGSFSWLDNNPGNITGVPGGPDFGQYPGKFNWHNFLIFPTWAAGFDAIAAFLRTPPYVTLSILDAFKRYAPASDGNDPVAYANSVAATLGVPVTTIVGSLTDDQMLVMQQKITDIEGAIAGDSLPWDSDQIPPEIATQLPAQRRRPRKPYRTEARGEPFSIDMSAPVDPSGFTSGLGGPNQGGHIGPNWYIQFGMDIGAAEGTPVYAAFDAHITVYHPDDPATDTAKVYGAQIFMRAPNDLMGAFYTHLKDVPAGIAPGAAISRGDLLGNVMKYPGVPPHLHIALVEIIGGQYVGVDLYNFILGLEATPAGTVATIAFSQDGSPPQPV